jgi:hypothetical protein
MANEQPPPPKKEKKGLKKFWKKIKEFFKDKPAAPATTAAPVASPATAPATSKPEASAAAKPYVTQRYHFADKG